VAPTSPGASTDGQSTIQVFSGLPDPFWISVAPAAAAAPPPSAGFPWLYSGAAFVLGCIAWSLLVSRGLVQRRSRKQTAAVAAHVEASRSETPALLEGRKRALMAGLKELELARQANEIDVATYDQLKAELKRETVIVMRALDEAGRPTPS
jgi:hypothetical protein